MILVSVYDTVLLIPVKARSSLPTAPLRPEPAARPATARFVRIGLGLSATLRRLVGPVSACPSTLETSTRSQA